MEYKGELKKIQDELREALKICEEKEKKAKPFDDSPGLELKIAIRKYNKKLRALKEKYNIKDGGTNTDK